uniref:Uncharacterized protein n=1 Tax=Siphoviridae sp. ctVf96 TaxID=2827882 RepID=A0A8S5TD78_9CAUD|nr:MAG TPA: hypothetical protein [Siphoviridae sp. ctVf96]
MCLRDQRTKKILTRVYMHSARPFSIFLLNTCVYTLYLMLLLPTAINFSNLLFLKILVPLVPNHSYDRINT